MMQTRKEKEYINVMTVLSGIASAGSSISIDNAQANAIFDAAREANSHFAYMTNDRIVSYCQGLDEAELNGMVSLVNGRYFENIVAEATGGTLFESKNHPDTDMTLDGTEISIKSNDATADSITEFDTISPQDLGMDDAELMERSAEVLDGDIIDATDALMSGTIGFGTMAMLEAAGKTLEEWEQLNEYQKTNMRAAWYGTKATGRAAISTGKSGLALAKLIGKGLKKGYDIYKESSEFSDKSVKESYSIGLNAPRTLLRKALTLTDGEIEAKARSMAEATGMSYEECLRGIKESLDS